MIPGNLHLKTSLFLIKSLDKLIFLRSSRNFDKDLKVIKYIPWGIGERKKVQDLVKWGTGNTLCHPYLETSRKYIKLSRKDFSQKSALKPDASIKVLSKVGLKYSNTYSRIAIYPIHFKIKLSAVM